MSAPKVRVAKRKATSNTTLTDLPIENDDGEGSGQNSVETPEQNNKNISDQNNAAILNQNNEEKSDKNNEVMSE